MEQLLKRKSECACFGFLSRKRSRRCPQKPDRLHQRRLRSLHTSLSAARQEPPGQEEDHHGQEDPQPHLRPDVSSRPSTTPPPPPGRSRSDRLLTERLMCRFEFSVSVVELHRRTLDVAVKNGGSILSKHKGLLGKVVSGLFLWI